MNTAKPFTKQQEKYIRENYESMTYKEMAADLVIAPSRVEYFCRLHGLKKQKEYARLEQKVIPDEPVKKIKRVPGNYSNVSREQHIERILNYQL